MRARLFHTPWVSDVFLMRDLLMGLSASLKKRVMSKRTNFVLCCCSVWGKRDSVPWKLVKKKNQKTVQDRILEHLLFCKVLRNSRIRE